MAFKDHFLIYLSIQITIFGLNLKRNKKKIKSNC